jgi:tRNA(fMet)-specific endonuclease VapC
VRLRFLLDTNILSEPLKLRPNPLVVEKIGQFRTEIAISSVTWHEIWFGYCRSPDSKKRQRTVEYLRDVIAPRVPILPYDTESAFWFAQERSRLVSLGRTLSFADGQIAAIAHTQNLILVTNNVSDYADFQNLQIENWFS